MQSVNDCLSTLFEVTDGHVLFDIWTGAEENCWWFDVEAMVVAKLANFIDYMVEVFDLLSLHANFEPWGKVHTALMPNSSDLM